MCWVDPNFVRARELTLLLGGSSRPNATSRDVERVQVQKKAQNLVKINHFQPASVLDGRR
jgi:hypothetical protein